MNYFIRFFCVVLFFLFVIPSISSAQGTGGVGNYSCPPGSKNTGFTAGQIFQCIDERTGQPVGYLNAFGFQTLQTSCTGTWSTLSNPAVCIGRWISEWVGTTLISLSAWLLAAVGELMNLAIQYSVATFKTGSQTTIGSYIDLIWTFARDLANVLILGMFTYIAISVIVGKVTLNNKRLIANVLVVALLINFSMLFAKTIVNTSNLFACQFYKVMVPGGTCDDPTNLTPQASAANANPANGFAKNGVSGMFVNALGVRGLSDTKALLGVLSEKTDNGFNALLVGIVSATFIFLVISTFIVITGMLIIRAVVLLFLICAGPIAFAAYLVPSWSHTLQNWWESLLRQSFLAPLLIALLWISGQFAQGVSSKEGILIKVVSDPGGNGVAYAVFSFLFIICLLATSAYLAFKFSSSLSSMSWAQGLSAGLAAFPIVGGLAGLGGLGRQTLGRYGYSRAQTLAQQMDAVRLDTSLDPKARERALQKLAAKQTFASGLANKEFNIMNSKLAQQFVKKAGVPTAFAGTSPGGGFAGNVKRGSESASPGYKEAMISSADQAKILEKKQKEIAAEKEEHEELIKAHQDSTRATRDLLAAQHESAKRNAVGADREVVSATREKERLERIAPDLRGPTHESDLRSAEDRIARAREKIETRNAIKQQLDEHNEAAARISNDHFLKTQELNLKLGKKKVEALEGIQRHTEYLNKKATSSPLSGGEGKRVGAQVVKTTGIADMLKGLKKSIESGTKENRRLADRIEATARAAALRRTPPTP